MKKPRPRPSLYDPLDWVVIRLPLLPIEAYLALGDRHHDHDHDRESPSSHRWRTSHDSALPADPLVRLALSVGSGHLSEALGEDGGGAANLDARAKLLRYQIRMSTRPTPYGLFAGVALGGYGAATAIAPDDTKPIWRARPDMEWLLSFVGAFEARPEVRRQLRIVAHPARFARSGRVFLSDPTPLKDATDSAVVSVRDSRAVSAALSHARSLIGYDQLADALCTELDAARDKIDPLLTELWRQGLMLTELRPPLTIASPAAYVAGRLESLADPPAEATGLRRALDALCSWNQLSPGEAVERWPALKTALADLHPNVDTTIQVDSRVCLTHSIVNTRIATEAARAAEVLLRLTPVPHGSSHLSAYRGAFEARYGQDREVPLLEALDPNFGLGPPAGHGSMAGVDGRRLAARNETLQSIALTALMQRRAIVEIDDATLDRLSLWDLDAKALPVSLDLAIFVIADSPDAVDRGAFQIAIGPNLGARQAGRYVSRFADLLGDRAVDALTNAAEAEKRHAPSAIWAELVYLPRRLRSGNVVVRPAIRDHEIAVGVPPGVPPDRAIPLDELTVGVRDGRFRLRWRGRDVIVRAGHMLTNFQAPQVCRFLDDVADDGIAQLSGFDWGPAFSYPFLPRIVYERCILSPARWRVDTASRDAEFSTNAREFPARLARFREHWTLPRYCYLAIGDNRLLLDLDSPAQADVLRGELAALRDGSALVLHEALPGPEHAWVEGAHGRYIAELIVPLVLRPFARESPARDVADETTHGGTLPNETLQSEPLQSGVLPEGALRPERAASASLANRMRPPGSDWLFAKLYAPAVLEEEFLIGPIRDFCHEMTRRRLTDGWFFVRYADPDPHVRLRFRGDPNRLLGELLPEICAWGAEVINEGVCRRFAFDTYDREIERYGGPAGMAVAEALFTADSPAAIDLLAVLRKATDLDRLTVMVASIDDLLASLALDEEQRRNWYKQRAKALHISGPDFRERKSMLRSLLGDANGLATLEQGPAIASIFGERRRSLASVAKRLATLSETAALGKPRGVLLESIVHMHCNRLAGADRNLEERALGLLFRVRQSLKEAPLKAQRR